MLVIFAITLFGILVRPFEFRIWVYSIREYATLTWFDEVKGVMQFQTA